MGSPALQEYQEWKLALKTGKTTKFGYASALWTDSNLFNQNSPATTEEDAKYQEFNTVPFRKIRMCVGSPDSNCVEHVFTRTYSSARALFSSGYIADSEVRKDDLLKAFGPAEGSYKDCPMQKPGAKLIESRSCYKLNARLLRACLFPLGLHSLGLASTSSAETATKRAGVGAPTALPSCASLNPMTTPTQPSDWDSQGKRQGRWEQVGRGAAAAVCMASISVC